MGEIGDPISISKSVPILLKVLDTDEEVLARSEAARALGKLGEKIPETERKKVIETLESVGRRYDWSQSVKDAVQFALERVPPSN